ncbi:hypothetical protein Herbaro_19755 [Herbaspirillum sp. WKF16]|jgi:hypothetical protein|uniref:hypothetical protein n=1 Tax=Herbaspirillum sp. WKF16 TaxID=3028312 RepID=UPI0023A918D5|nr:hypothetical protein [Herbaspirillum sp. WKF16]WDZ95685.1 hypothetical protein Herbaro_19755 [Herbaspirillum sp. WKF16]
MEAALSRALPLRAIGVSTMAGCAKIAHREVNRDAAPHIERAWDGKVFAHCGKHPARRLAHAPCPFLQEGIENA